MNKQTTFWHSIGLASVVLALSACNHSGPNVEPASSATQPMAASSTGISVDTTSTQSVAFKQIDLTALRATGSTPAICALDTIDGVPIKSPENIELNHSFTMEGWVATSDKRAPAEFTIVLKGNDSYGAEAHTGVVRPDVEKAFDSSEVFRGGFVAESALSGVPGGTYEVDVVVRNKATSEWCDTGRKFVIR